MSPARSVARLLVLLLAAGLLQPAAPALASHSGCVPKNEATFANLGFAITYLYDYNICDVPDIDQRRDSDPQQNIAGLTNGGRCYCVPTSTLNWLSYIARHGYPELAPGSDNYQLSPPFFNDVYNKITTYQAVLGGPTSMDLNPGFGDDPCGVGSTKAVPAVEDWFDQHGLASSFSVVYVRENATTGYVPLVLDAALAAVQGQFVMLHIGWYDDEGGVLERNGGHVVSLVKAEGPYQLGGVIYSLVGFHDPGTAVGADTLSQSQFVRDVRPTKDVTEAYADADGQERTRSRIFGYRQDRGRLDAFYSIIPKFALGDGPDHSVQQLEPVFAGQGTPPPTHSQLLPGSLAVADIAIIPHRSIQPFVVEGGDEIKTVDLATDEIATFAEARGVRRLAFGGLAERLYGLTPEALLAFDRDGELVRTAPTRTPLHEFAFDPAGERVVALDAERGVLHLFSADLDPVGTVDLDRWPGGDASLTVEPRSGDVWVLPDGSARALRVSPRGQMSLVELGDGGALTGLHAGDDGRLYAVADGQVASFHLDGSGAGDSPFDGQPASSWVRILQSWTNAGPDDEVGPEWDNVPPWELPDDDGRLTLVQQRDEERVGAPHAVQALLRDDAGSVGGVDIHFEIDGPGASDGMTRTDPNGMAEIAWTSTSPGEDVLTAWADLNDDGQHQDGEPLDAAAVVWTPAGETAPLAGPSRTDTAVAVSRAAFGDGGARAVVLARDDDFADGLTAGPLAVERDGPLLLSGRTRLPAATLTEVQRVLPAGGPVLLVGGTAVLSEQVEEQLRAAGYTTERIAGRDRFETSIAVARMLGDPSTRLLVTGRNFADALAVGPAAGTAAAAVLLTDDDRMPRPVAAYLAQHPDGTTLAVGGPAARAAPGAAALVGEDRYGTAVAVAETFFPDPLLVGIASGQDFPDGLTGGAHLGRLDAPVLLTPRNRLADVVEQYLRSRPGVRRAFVYGGDAAISPEVHRAVASALGQPPR